MTSDNVCFASLQYGVRNTYVTDFRFQTALRRFQVQVNLCQWCVQNTLAKQSHSRPTGWFCTLLYSYRLCLRSAMTCNISHTVRWVCSPHHCWGATSSPKTYRIPEVSKIKSGNGWLLPYSPSVLLMSFIDMQPEAFSSVHRGSYSLWMAQTRIFNAESDTSSPAIFPISWADQLGRWDRSQTKKKKADEHWDCHSRMCRSNVSSLTAADTTALHRSLLASLPCVHFTKHEHQLVIESSGLNLRWKELRLGCC